MTEAVTLPRLVIAAPASGHGKTTVTIGVMAALRRRGLEVAPAKVGPDYIDPGYHSLAAGRPGRNLDPFLVGEELVTPLLLHGARTPKPCDVAVIEGVMGLYDGRLGTAGFASTAHVAALTDSPVVLVVDVRHVSRTVGAVVQGLASFDPSVTVAGVILNQVGSPRHEAEIRRVLDEIGMPVVGALPRDRKIESPSRHLGLVPAEERPESSAVLEALADHVVDRVDLDLLLDLARSAPPLPGPAWDPVAALSADETSLVADVQSGAGPGAAGSDAERPVVAVAGGRAFTFRYAETTELLAAAGCTPVVFDPLRDPSLPEGTRGLYLGGGFPEVHAAELTANEALRAQIADAVVAGMPTVAECAGLLYLCRTVDGVPMTGALPVEAAMAPRLTMGYRRGVAPADLLVAAQGEEVAGHEFHRTQVCLPEGGLGSGAWSAAWELDGREDGVSADPAGTGRPTVHASYLHTHWAGCPRSVRNFAAAVRAFEPAAGAQIGLLAGAGAEAASQDVVSVAVASAGAVDLHHHGDDDLAPGLVDLAVNVRPARTPDVLVQAVVEDADWAAYPDVRPLREALAAHHGVPVESVLPTAGGAEAFTLVARAVAASMPVVVHPQFTEPEAALTAAGRRVRRHVLTAGHGFRLDPGAIADDADLVVVGNPTNPTSVLHPASVLDALRRPGRVLVVDEAFMDAVPGEPESLIRPGDLAGVLVLRSLTKTWGIAGLRAGYVVGDPELVAGLAAQQPPWSVSTPAIRAGLATLTASAQQVAAEDARRLPVERDDLVARLRAVGAEVVTPAQGPFVLVDTSAWGSGSVREALAAEGFAVRRGETFPGLGESWIRVAVRDAGVHERFVAAVARVHSRARG
ncbi:cobyrinate a,c-diamide synthase [Austwickia chelonae]|uniref:cobyrinate a,c-diamide synthase n=1 Tax=Austwickia chelonae TaxID=100225 RepID=UPI000E232ED5|nr:cobyrinate a,c-diamide synthase [Austwickia chelonae]